MTKIPSDDILERLYKLRIRESEKLKTVLELYDLEIHQKKAGPDYHRLKTMVKRSIEQDLRNKNFGARNGNYETNAVLKNERVKQREQRSLGDCWQWKANGQCSKGDNCSFRHDINKRGKMAQPNPSPRSSTRQSERNASRTRSPRGKSPSGRMFRLPCKDYLKGTCTATNGILQNACSTRRRMDADLVKSAVICAARLTNSKSKPRSREEAVRHDRTGKPVVCPQAGAPQTRFSRDSTNFNVEDETNHDRTEKLVVCRDADHERSMLNEVDIDFRLPGFATFCCETS